MKAPRLKKAPEAGKRAKVWHKARHLNKAPEAGRRTGAKRKPEAGIGPQG